MRTGSRTAVLGVFAGFLFGAAASAQLPQNLVVNGSFDTGLGGWSTHAPSGVIPSWQATDATGGPGSGAARAVLPAGRVTGTVVLEQCVNTNASPRYSVSLRVRISAVGAQRGVAVLSANDGVSCGGNFLAGGPVFVNAAPAAGWQTAHALLAPPPGTSSYRLQLMVPLGSGSGANTVDFDDVYLGPSPPGPSACAEEATILCLDDALGDDRFQVHVRFAIQNPPSGDAQAINLDGLGVTRGGLFWFFSADNPELLIKVLNGCGLNNRFWVFVSAGTNVVADVFVGDSDTGAVVWVHNPPNRTFATVQDVGALPCS